MIFRVVQGKSCWWHNWHSNLICAPLTAGIRPKISGPGEKNADFLIQGPEDHGIHGVVNLFGIESPGLTASLSIGDYVTNLLKP